MGADLAITEVDENVACGDVNVIGNIGAMSDSVVDVLSVKASVV